MEKQHKTGILFVVTLTVIFLIVIFAVKQNVPPHPIEKRLSSLPEARVIAAFGQDPEITELRNRTISIDELTKKTQQDIHPYLYPDGPIIGYGKDMKGSIVVMIYENWTLNQTVINEIHDRIAARGKEYGIDPVPCRFIWMDMIVPD
jgi:ABC-type lipoprotein release transport system permease subunit